MNREETFILIRADSFDKAMIALADAVRYGGLKILGDPRIIHPTFSDWILEDVTGEKPKKAFRSHVAARVEGEAGLVIDRVRRIHPPAHVLVVPRDTKAWKELSNLWGTFEKLRGFHPPKVRSRTERES